MSRVWGIRMGHCGDELENLLKQHVALKGADQPYTLIEVGSANCVSLRAFADILAETKRPGGYRAIGFDLTPGKAWSMDMTEVQRAFTGLPYQVHTQAGAYWGADQFGMSLMLLDDPRSYLPDIPTPMFDWVFIDGCHGKCAGLDFLAVEPKVAPGGLVVFHDYGEAEQGTDYQSHCNEFINVRTYVHRLGLRQPTNRLRKGWRWIAELPGSRVFGTGDGNSAAVVQRTEEPLEPDAPGVE